eukprot:3373789-Pleurochrysis_carterae.AAC.1
MPFAIASVRICCAHLLRPFRVHLCRAALHLLQPARRCTATLSVSSSVSRVSYFVQPVANGRSSARVN